MSSKHKEILFLLEVDCLIGAIALGWNPWPSGLALLVLLAYRVADKYFHDTFYDENKLSISRLKEEFAKLKAKQDHTDLSSAFGGRK